jgi:thiopeptide-type bacteriocin biosynthesis protein
VIEPAPFFLLRTPLLPFAFQLELAGTPDGDADPIATAECIRRRLGRAVERADIREALFLASPSFHETLPLWLREPTSERGQKAERTLIRYLARMSARPTPFGLFAGCSVGRTGDVTRLTLGAPQDYRRRTRLDSEYLCELGDALTRQPPLRKRLRYFTNTTLYARGDSFRYAEQVNGSRGRSYRLVSVERSDYLEAILSAAGKGAAYVELSRLLVDSFGVATEQADTFLDELIDGQLLISALTPVPVGADPIVTVIDELERAGAADEGAALHDAQARLRALDVAGVGAPLDEYAALAHGMAALPVRVSPARICQVDLFKPAPTLTLGKAPLDELERGIRLLHALPFGRPAETLARFRRAFRERYGEAEVPLVEVLDGESGLVFARDGERAGDASPLLSALPWPPPAATSPPWLPLHQLLLRKLEPTFADARMELSLSDGELVALAQPDPLPLPTSFAATICLSAVDEAAVDRGDFTLLIQHVVGPPGIRFLARFSHLDTELERLVRAEADYEQQLSPDALLAEIVFSPPGHVGNIVNRPALRDHEIPYLSRSLVPSPQQIPIDDLRVSVVGDRVVLRSAARGCEIIPRHSSALNARPGQLSLYRFLRAVQDQGLATALEWDWGPLASCSFLPRVVSGRLILSLARWRLDSADLSGLTGDAAALAQLRALRRLPRFVNLVESDSALTIDLENAVAVAALAHAARQSPQLVLTECFPPPDQLCVSDARHRYTHEMIVPFRASAVTAAPPDAFPRPARVNPSERRCAPGSSWAYLKLYCGEATIDRILREQVGPFCARHSHAIERWFFVRYDDPESHLRLRLRGRDAAATTMLRSELESAAAALLANGQISRVQVDTYEREIERYGGVDELRLCEALFCADSAAVVAILGQLEMDDLHARWQATLLGMATLLDDMALSVAAKLDIARRRRDMYREELRADIPMLRQIGEQFRSQRRRLDELLHGRAATTTLAPVAAILAQRSAATRPLIAELAARVAADERPAALARWAANFMHMHANRMLRGSLRAHELVLYDFLYRLYDGERSRQR